MENFEGLWYDTENKKTRTSVDQCSCEMECSKFLRSFTCYDANALRNFQRGGLINVDQEIRLLKSKHASYLKDYLTNLPGGFISLEASRPWILYWILHALNLLGYQPVFMYPRVISTLKHIQNASGGYGGGAGHLSQGAPNYAAVLSLCSIATEEAWASIDRPAMYNYFMRMKQPNGSFSIHEDGEADSRSTYTFIAIARLLNILTDELKDKTADFLLSCQTYEGGFGGEPGNEAHGGYNFCALAALLILKQAHRCDLFALENWLLRRQSRLEGGFQGRTNKLVDSCYSFWQGAAMAMVEAVRRGGDDLYDLDLFLHSEANPSTFSPDLDDDVGGDEIAPTAVLREMTEMSGVLPFNQQALQRYVLHCAQAVETGGMRDKPGKSRDFYHTCYSLSGLSIAQHGLAVGGDGCGPHVFGDADNLLAPTSVVYNIGLPQLKRTLDYFSAFSNDHQQLVDAFESRTNN